MELTEKFAWWALTDEVASYTKLDMTYSVFCCKVPGVVNGASNMSRINNIKKVRWLETRSYQWDLCSKLKFDTAMTASIGKSEVHSPRLILLDLVFNNESIWLDKKMKWLLSVWRFPFSSFWSTSVALQTNHAMIFVVKAETFDDLASNVGHQFNSAFSFLWWGFLVSWDGATMALVDVNTKCFQSQRDIVSFGSASCNLPSCCQVLQTS